MTKETIGIIAFGILSLLALSYFTAILYFGNLVRIGVNETGPAMLQAPVALDDGTLAPMSGLGTLTDLRIGNPTGWSKTDALRVSRVQLQVKPFSVFSDLVDVSELEIENLEINYEMNPGASNLGDLLKNAEHFLGLNRAKTRTDDGRSVRLIVRHFVLTKASVTLSAGGRNQVVPLPEITLVDLGVREGGLTPPQLGHAILRSVNAKVVAASARASGAVVGAKGAAR